MKISVGVLYGKVRHCRLEENMPDAFERMEKPSNLCKKREEKLLLRLFLL